MGKFKVGDHVKGISECGTVETNADGYSPVSGTVSSFVINGQEYTNEQYIKDCERFVKEFPHDKNIELNHAIEYVLTVYQWAQQNPIVTNLDHCAEEFGWTEDRKKGIADSICPLIYTTPRCERIISCQVCRNWWKQEWKGGKA